MVGTSSRETKSPAKTLMTQNKTPLYTVHWTGRAVFRVHGPDEMLAVFSGPEAENRASAYASWMNSLVSERERFEETEGQAVGNTVTVSVPDPVSTDVEIPIPDPGLVIPSQTTDPEPNVVQTSSIAAPTQKILKPGWRKERL